MDVAQLAFAGEDFLGPFTRVADASGKGTEELNDLGNMIVILTVLSTRLWVKEIVPCDQFKYLEE